MRQYYEVKLDQFEGPLDLLLYLVQRDEVDIAQISVSRITEQYLLYLDVMRELNINVAADYLHMASILVRLKAHEMLPQSEAVAVEEEDGIYNRDQLIQQLLEYKKFKEAAHSLRQFEASQAGSFARGEADHIDTEAPDEQTIGNVSVYDLLAAFQKVLEQAQTEKPSHTVKIDPATRLDDRIEHVLGMLMERGEVLFGDLFAADHRRIVIVVTFLAILELVKMQEIVFRQEENFAGIFVSRRDPETREAPVVEPGEIPVIEQQSGDSVTEAAPE